ncbi:MAG: lipocalin family protein [Planctomycetota bacterium]
MARRLGLLGALGMLLQVTGCQSYPPIRTEASVDLERFMGDWFVIAHIPAAIERHAHNGVESYRLDDDGTIATTYRFNAGALDGPEKVYRPRGFVRDASNAVWGMRFLWPFTAEYRIVYVDPEYELTVIGRTKRDYVWIMARQQKVPEAKYQQMIELLVAEGYELGNLRLVPHGRASDAPAPTL